MNVKVYYYKGTITNEKEIIDKIERDSKRCHWHDSDDMIDKTFTGYKMGNEYYDICSYLYKKDLEIFRKKQDEYIQKFYKIKNELALNQSLKRKAKFIQKTVNMKHHPMIQRIG